VATVRERLAWRTRRAVLSSAVPFEVRCRLLYWEQRRHWSTRRPSTFSQKLLWRLTYDRRPILVTFVDKLAMRDYVAATVGPSFLTTLYATAGDPAELDLGSLPREFVVKPNHGSQMLWIVADWAGDEVRVVGTESGAVVPGGSILSNRRSLDRDRLMATCRGWLDSDYGDLAHEWAYRLVPRRLLVEELLPGPGRPPPDFKLYVFDGRVEYVSCNMDRFGPYKLHWARPDWTPFDPGTGIPAIDPPPPPPASLERMVDAASALGESMDFVRVDMYEVDGRALVGELTVYPGGRGPANMPESFGRSWTLPAKRR
jgi:hypothetical protein